MVVCTRCIAVKDPQAGCTLLASSACLDHMKSPAQAELLCSCLLHTHDASSYAGSCSKQMDFDLDARLAKLHCNVHVSHMHTSVPQLLTCQGRIRCSLRACADVQQASSSDSRRSSCIECHSARPDLCTS